MLNTRRSMAALMSGTMVAVYSFVFIPLQAQAPAPAKAPSAREQLLRTVVEQAYIKFKDDTKGKNADYIPYLAQVDPNLFGISVITTHGHVYSTGDTAYSFSIQSISKVYSLALAMEELGADRVFAKIGSEPTGRAFNPGFRCRRHANPHRQPSRKRRRHRDWQSLIPAKNAADKWNKILNFYSDAAGEKLRLIDEVYKSEAATNQGNRALAALLLKYERIYADGPESVDVYTKQCSVGVNVKQLGMMAATLANGGKNPITDKQVIKPENIPHILSTMTMAGLYDGSGGWAWNVGLPAKSGVGGGIIAVIPGQGAIAVFSPRLDEAGNSVKAQEVIAYIAGTLKLNVFDAITDQLEVAARTKARQFP